MLLIILSTLSAHFLGCMFPFTSSPSLAAADFCTHHQGMYPWPLSFLEMLSQFLSLYMAPLLITSPPNLYRTTMQERVISVAKLGDSERAGESSSIPSSLTPIEVSFEKAMAKTGTLVLNFNSAVTFWIRFGFWWTLTEVSSNYFLTRLPYLAFLIFLFSLFLSLLTFAASIST